MINLKIEKETWDILIEYCKIKGITLAEGFDYVINLIKSRIAEEKEIIIVKEVRPRIELDDETSDMLKSEARRKRMSSSKLVELCIDTVIGSELGAIYRDNIEKERRELEKLMELDKNLHQKLI